MSGFCIDCGSHIENFEGLNACPHCKSQSVPCADADQVTVTINWQELRVLGVWAERWALEKLPGAGTVYAIMERIARQYPDKVKENPLTLAGEIGQLKDKFGNENIQTNFPGV